jgi:hypothetical protein
VAGGNSDDGINLRVHRAYYQRCFSASGASNDRYTGILKIRQGLHSMDRAAEVLYRDSLHSGGQVSRAKVCERQCHKPVRGKHGTLGCGKPTFRAAEKNYSAMFTLVVGPVKRADYAVTPEWLGANACPREMTDESSGSNHAKIVDSFDLGNYRFEPIHHRKERNQRSLRSIGLHRPKEAHRVDTRVVARNRSLYRNVDGAILLTAKHCGTGPSTIVLVLRPCADHNLVMWAQPRQLDGDALIHQGRIWGDDDSNLRFPTFRKTITVGA